MDYIMLQSFPTIFSRNFLFTPIIVVIMPELSIIHKIIPEICAKHDQDT